ncbi:hypothetical protein EVAR_76186_1 [Eumeta japonica]|uniref:Uncharacterized protein n=1 Tax=Eumeta variegata TaxID=151549 RepID=A0A4C1UVX1_EUMVA|nr:hypothetical protein EVAR_76186_1 [Eumeta japonica]
MKDSRVQVRDGGLIVVSCPGVFSSGTRPRRIKWQWLEPLFLEFCRCRRRTACGRARIAHAQSPGGGGHPAWSLGTRREWEGGVAQVAHAADRRWSDAGGRRPDQGGTNR